MSAILDVFGIDWRLLIINMVNFGLLLLALWYFLYGPLTKMMRERRELVAKGVEDAQKAQEELRNVEAARSGKLAEAAREADAALAEARKAAGAVHSELVAKSEASASRIVAEAEAQAGEMKARALQESKEEVAKLIVLGMEKAMAKK